MVSIYVCMCYTLVYCLLICGLQISSHYIQPIYQAKRQQNKSALKANFKEQNNDLSDDCDDYD